MNSDEIINEELPISENLGTTGVNSTQEKIPNMSQETTGPIPRFLIMRRKNGDFTRVSPFLIHRVMYGLIGTTNDLKKVKDGLLIETKTRAQAERLLSIEKFSEFEVEVVPHKTLNKSKGVVFCKDFLNCTIEEIEEELKSQGVTKVTRMKQKKGHETVDSPNHILEFNSTKLPTNIHAALYNLRVRPYFPAPMRCFNCQRFGHISSRFETEKTCICGKKEHEGECVEPIIWYCLGDNMTDPISIECPSKTVSSVSSKRWILNKANWDLYRAELNNLREVNLDNIDDAVEEISTAILNAA
nr:uncharacterized protein LOC111514915 [Leptinotarsa decemlineata]